MDTDTATKTPRTVHGAVHQRCTEPRGEAEGAELVAASAPVRVRTITGQQVADVVGSTGPSRCCHGIPDIPISPHPTFWAASPADSASQPALILGSGTSGSELDLTAPTHRACARWISTTGRRATTA